MGVFVVIITGLPVQAQPSVLKASEKLKMVD